MTEGVPHSTTLDAPLSDLLSGFALVCETRSLTVETTRRYVSSVGVWID